MREFLGMVESQNSPTVYRDKTEYIFQGETGTGAEAMATLEAWAEVGTMFYGGYVDIDSCRATHNIRMDVVYVVTTREKKNFGASAVDGDIEINIDSNEQELMVERHQKYLAIWNYDLFYLVKFSLETGLPLDATNLPPGILKQKTRILNIKDAARWKFSKTQPPDTTLGGSPARWFLFKERTKDAEAFPVSVPVVTVVKHFKSKSSAKNALKGYNTFETPPEVPPGVSRDSKCWRKKPLGVQMNGRTYTATIVYQYADKWDEDFYKK